jgi:hypothetical protein
MQVDKRLVCLIKNVIYFLFVRLTYQPLASSSFFSQQTTHQQLDNNTFHSQQINTGR